MKLINVTKVPCRRRFSFYWGWFILAALKHHRIMLNRAGHAVPAIVVYALVLLFICQPGYCDCRGSCVSYWSSLACWSEVDTSFPTGGRIAFLFHLWQYRTSRASLKNNKAYEPLLSGVVSESCSVICDNLRISYQDQAKQMPVCILLQFDRDIPMPTLRWPGI